ncbi:MAG: decaprenyl-phosphate phosphoribosyltransferase, partial [Acidimicrobiales bacterium]
PETGQHQRAPAGPFDVVTGLFVSARPRQWLKNLLVFAAPWAAGVLHEGPALRDASLAFVAFCAMASGLYLFNDVVDRDADRVHPTKQFRPIAAGVVPPTGALVVAAVLGLAGIVAAAATGQASFVLLVVAYGAITVSYCLWLKHEPVIDLAAVAAGFVLRAVGGAAAVDVHVSAWFLIVALFGSLLMVTGKRRAELEELEDAGDHRSVLEHYSSWFLDHVLAVSSAAVILAYCLWALESDQLSGGGIYQDLSVVPFTIAILRYVLRIGNGEGGAPEDIVLHDRGLLALGAVWAAVFGLGVYVA